MILQSSVLVLFSFYSVFCSDISKNSLNANTPTPFYENNLGNAPLEILINISEYVGACNPLPTLNKHTRHCLIDLYSIASFAEIISGIKGISECKISEPDYNCLLALPKFRYKSSRLEFFLHEILNGRFKSTRNPIFAHIIKILMKLDSFSKMKLQKLLRFTLLSKLDSLKLSDLPLATLEEFGQALDSMNLKVSYKLFSSCPACDLSSLLNALFRDNYLRLSCAPYIALLGADEKVLMPYLNEFSNGARAKGFYNIINEPMFIPDSKCIENLENLMKKYFPIETTNTVEVFLIAIYLNTLKGTISDDKVLKLNNVQSLFPENIADFASMMSRSGKSHLVSPLLKHSAENVDFYTARLGRMSHFVMEFVESYEYAIRMVKDLIAAAPAGQSHPFYLGDFILDVFFAFYKVELATFSSDKIILNCAPVSAVEDELFIVSEKVKIRLIQVFTEPVTLILKSSQSSDLMREINTLNISVLERLLELSDFSSLRVDFNRFEMSPAFLIASQLSDDFHDKLWEWREVNGLTEFKYGLKDLIGCLDYPVNNIIGKVEINFSDFRVLDKTEHFINLMQLTGYSLLDLYRILGVDALDIPKITSLRRFFVFWLESDNWRSLALTKNKMLLDYLAVDYPQKIAEIRVII